jgi:hypothetical protein
MIEMAAAAAHKSGSIGFELGSFVAGVPSSVIGKHL